MSVTAQLHEWFKAEPWRTGRELLRRLQAEHPGTYSDGLLRTLQRRLKIWRSKMAHAMVFGPPLFEREELPGLSRSDRHVVRANDFDLDSLDSALTLEPLKDSA